MALAEIRLANLLRLPDGRTVEFETVGEGEPLLWIEGGPGFFAHLARPDVKLLANRFRCYLVNAPGCGRTTPPAQEKDYDYMGHVRFFEEVRRALGLGAVTVMGHSWGGLIALAYGAHLPETVRRLVVIEGYAGDGSVNPAEAEAEQEAILDRVRHQQWFPAAWEHWQRASAVRIDSEAEWVESFRPCWPLYFSDPSSLASQSHIERLRRECRIHMTVSRIWEEQFSTLDLRPLIAQVSCPVLLVVGEHDFLVGPVWAEALHEVLLASELVVFSSCGHVPQYEKPQVFRRALYSWCDRT